MYCAIPFAAFQELVKMSVLQSDTVIRLEGLQGAEDRKNETVRSFRCLTSNMTIRPHDLGLRSVRHQTFS